MNNNSIQIIFSLKLKHNFNCFSLGKVFNSLNKELIVGHEDGMVRTYAAKKSDALSAHPNCLKCYETKGGPIQSIMVANIMKLFSNDLVAADSKGYITFFCNEQILTRSQLFQYRIQHMISYTDAANNSSLIACDSEGNLCSFTSYGDLWRIKLSDVQSLKSLGLPAKVTCMTTVDLKTPHNNNTTCRCIVVADNLNRVMMFNNDTLFAWQQASSQVYAICQGNFIDEDDMESPNCNNPQQYNNSQHYNNINSNNPQYQSQLLLGCDNGCIYIMANLQIFKEEFINIGFPIRTLCQFSRRKRDVHKRLDYVAVSGNTNIYSIVQNGKEIFRHEADSWINGMMMDVDDAGGDRLLFSCIDSTLHAHKLFLS